MKNNDFVDRNLLLVWLILLLLNMILLRTNITNRLDKIEKQNKEIVEYIKNGDVEE